MNARKVLRKALSAECVPDLPVLDSSDSVRLERLLGDMPENGFVSEWRNDLGKVSYEYRVHDETEGAILRQLLKSGSVGRYPLLTAVYSREDIRSFLVPPASSGYSEQIHY
ncbi:hypothetical protein KY349_03585 [Candidatus Woesearchaeota archaeon]|nr:hypothetical protein [Candidatus Woesearchaeota archaeon]